MASSPSVYRDGSTDEAAAGAVGTWGGGHGGTWGDMGGHWGGQGRIWALSR
jgi:hypothetical protein